MAKNGPRNSWKILKIPFFWVGKFLKNPEKSFFFDFQKSVDTMEFIYAIALNLLQIRQPSKSGRLTNGITRWIATWLLCGTLCWGWNILPTLPALGEIYYQQVQWIFLWICSISNSEKNWAHPDWFQSRNFGRDRSGKNMTCVGHSGLPKSRELAGNLKMEPGKPGFFWEITITAEKYQIKFCSNAKQFKN